MGYVQGNENDGLAPVTSAWMHKLFEHSKTVESLIAEYGSPINIHHIPTFANKIDSFKDFFNKYDLRYQIFYARKANKCRSLVKQSFKSGIGVDTASYRELKQTLKLGGTSKNIILTSAIKTTSQINLAAKNNITIILDNQDECRMAQSIAKKLGKKVDVGIRISGFVVQGEKLYSRFGFDIDVAEKFVMDLIGQGKKFDRLVVKGLHFHLDGYSTFQRAKALSDLIFMANRLRTKGYPIDFIDIGGGILMNYLESESQWEQFKNNLKNAVKNGSEVLTFNGDGLGYQFISGKLQGTLQAYPYFNKIHELIFLKEIMEHKDENINYSNAERLKKQDLELRIEPGRSLLNQTGITIAKVIHRKMDAKGQWLIGLEMNMSQLKSSSRDFLLDPYILYKKEIKLEKPAVEVFFTGAYCLESDILLKRKVTLPMLPGNGDLIAFINTAGYMMHFFETEAHLFELSKNLVYMGTDGTPKKSDFLLDE